MAKKKKKPPLHVDPIPQLSDAEKEYMYSALIRCDGFRDELLDGVVNSHVTNDDEKYQLLLKACRGLRKEGLAPQDKGFRKRLKTMICVLVEEEGPAAELSTDAMEELIGVGGLIDRAFGTKSADYDLDNARSLLKRYLLYYKVFSELDSYLHTVLSEGMIPGDVPALLDQLRQLAAPIDGIGTHQLKSLSDRWAEHKARQERTWDRSFLGLKTGLPGFDSHTLGVRGLFFLAARPGAGKTTFTLQLAVGVCRHHAENDAVVVVVSLDMAAHDLMDRVHCHLAGIEWQVLKFGSPAAERKPGQVYSKAVTANLDAADKRLADEQIGPRLIILDRTDLGEHITVARLAAVVREAKQQAGAKRALLVLDYLQLIPVPEELESGGDLAADKARVRVVQQVIEAGRTADDPVGDAALVISEARKPPSAKEQWGSSLSELMGSARLAYAADAVLLYHEMSVKQVMEAYGLKAKTDVPSKLAALKEKGIVPIVLNLEKGRDGMRRGYWDVEFHFRKSTFVELNPAAKLLKSVPPSDGPSAAVKPSLPPTAAPFTTLKAGKSKKSLGGGTPKPPSTASQNGSASKSGKGGGA